MLYGLCLFVCVFVCDRFNVVVRFVCELICGRAFACCLFVCTFLLLLKACLCRVFGSCCAIWRGVLCAA